MHTHTHIHTHTHTHTHTYAHIHTYKHTLSERQGDDYSKIWKITVNVSQF